jgi:hypothetical protein
MAVVPALIGLVPSKIPFTFSICQGHAQLKWPSLENGCPTIFLWQALNCLLKMSLQDMVNAKIKNKQ